MQRACATAAVVRNLLRAEIDPAATKRHKVKRRTPPEPPMAYSHMAAKDLSNFRQVIKQRLSLASTARRPCSSPVLARLSRFAGRAQVRLARGPAGGQNLPVSGVSAVATQPRSAS